MQTQDKACKAKSAAQVEQEFAVLATASLKALKERSGLSFGQISKTLEERDLGTETPGQLKAKFRRGKFSYVFLMRVMMAMNVAEVKFFDVRKPEPGVVPKGFNLKMSVDRLPAGSSNNEGGRS